MRKHRNTKTSKKFERTQLLNLEGCEIFAVGKFTQAKNYVGNVCLRLITEVKVYQPDGQVLEVNHLWIPTEDNSHNEKVWTKHFGSYRKFKAKVMSYGLVEKKASVVIEDLDRDVWKFEKKKFKR